MLFQPVAFKIGQKYKFEPGWWRVNEDDELAAAKCQAMLYSQACCTFSQEVGVDSHGQSCCPRTRNPVGGLIS